MPLIMRIVNFLLAIMFLIFAFLQINDPDPVIWILIYGIMAVYCVMAMFELYPQRFLIATAAIYTLYSLLYAPGVASGCGRTTGRSSSTTLPKWSTLTLKNRASSWVC